MSRQARLPPRCPIQKKPIAGINDSVFQSLHIDESYPPHHNSSYQSSIPEEPPTWLDDLLSDQDSISKGMYHRRSVSDSIALLDALADTLPSLALHKDDENSVVNETCNGLESACTYGPNSPRKKSNLTFVENAIVSALSESVSQDPTHYVDGNLRISATTHADWKGDDCNSVGDLNTEKKAVKGLESKLIC
jgi:hypothetical protein